MNDILQLVPTKYRKAIYVALSIVATLYAIWTASGGEWQQFTVALVTALVTALAQANTVEVHPDNAILMRSTSTEKV